MDRYRFFYLSVALVNVCHVYFVCSAPLKPRSNKRHLINQSLYTPSLAMLFLLFLYYLLHGPSIDAGPIPTIENRSLVGNHCNDLTHCRTIWNIVWSCLATIFSCTWVAVHPNVPCPKKREANGWIERHIRNPLISFVEHRLPLFICALLVPEYVLAWSIRQFLVAQKIAKGEIELCVKYLSIVIILSKSLLERGWSKTHGFFIIMGGFHLFEHHPIQTSNNNKFRLHDDDIPLCPLAARDLYGDHTYQSIEADIDFTSFTVPTEEEINDRGKSDWLAKSLVLLQTSWFVMQCIARAKEHLPITHLKIVTLAYATMNFVIYIFWWNKPLNVNRPVRVFRKSERSATQHQVISRETRRSRAWELTWREIGEGLETIFLHILGNQDKNVDLSRGDRVPRFWADSVDEGAIADLIVLGVGVCFGAIHCISWGFSFPTHTELLMWRILCVAITAVPIYITLGYFLANQLNKMNLDKFSMPVALISILPAGILYILARAITLVLAFTSLRGLPPGAYETVHWTTFIPHV